jgi:2-dehydropantoate 2-reductase
MKITVIGAGAVGGLLAVRLAESGHQVSVVARGKTLAAIHADGLTIATPIGIRSIEVAIANDPRHFGEQDMVIVAVKTTALQEVAPLVAPLLGEDTAVIGAMNGVPWWFFADPALPHAGLQLRTIDPQGLLSHALPARHMIGCVVHLTSTSPAPGVIEPGLGNRLIFGEALGGMSKRVTHIVAAFANAGFDAAASTAIRADIWYKLWGNMTLNPLSAMTGTTCDQLLDDPLVKAFCLRVMQEAAAIGEQIGCPQTQSGEERMQLTQQLGAFKTSMLQDAESGKPLEIDALVSVVHEIGQHLGLATPNIDSLLGMVRVFGRCRGLY